MIFKLKPTKEYGEGDTRKIKSFCWLPKRVGDDIIWCENVIITQKYYPARMCSASGSIIDAWWDNISYEVERTE